MILHRYVLLFPMLFEGSVSLQNIGDNDVIISILDFRFVPFYLFKFNKADVSKILFAMAF